MVCYSSFRPVYIHKRGGTWNVLTIIVKAGFSCGTTGTLSLYTHSIYLWIEYLRWFGWSVVCWGDCQYKDLMLNDTNIVCKTDILRPKREAVLY